jgi:hypothetical protein
MRRLFVQRPMKPSVGGAQHATDGSAVAWYDGRADPADFRGGEIDGPRLTDDAQMYTNPALAPYVVRETIAVLERLLAGPPTAQPHLPPTKVMARKVTLWCACWRKV